MVCRLLITGAAMDTVRMRAVGHWSVATVKSRYRLEQSARTKRFVSLAIGFLVGTWGALGARGVTPPA